ncbi:MAG: hypothetical protein V4568_12770 [Pseudomonadota bacterium]
MIDDHQFLEVLIPHLGNPDHSPIWNGHTVFIDALKNNFIDTCKAHGHLMLAAHAEGWIDDNTLKAHSLWKQLKKQALRGLLGLMKVGAKSYDSWLKKNCPGAYAAAFIKRSIQPRIDADKGSKGTESPADKVFADLHEAMTIRLKDGIADIHAFDPPVLKSIQHLASLVKRYNSETNQQKRNAYYHNIRSELSKLSPTNISNQTSTPVITPAVKRSPSKSTP